MSSDAVERRIPSPDEFEEIKKMLIEFDFDGPQLGDLYVILHQKLNLLPPKKA